MTDLQRARQLANERGYRIHQLRVSARGATGRKRKQGEDDFVLTPLVEGTQPTISFDTLPELVAYLREAGR